MSQRGWQPEVDILSERSLRGLSCCHILFFSESCQSKFISFNSVPQKQKKQGVGRDATGHWCSHWCRVTPVMKQALKLGLQGTASSCCCQRVKSIIVHQWRQFPVSEWVSEYSNGSLLLLTVQRAYYNARYTYCEDNEKCFWTNQSSLKYVALAHSGSRTWVAKRLDGVLYRPEP